jgi:hypothetical protein
MCRIPRFFLSPVFAFFLREYRRNSPDFSLRIIFTSKMLGAEVGLSKNAISRARAPAPHHYSAGS